MLHPGGEGGEGKGGRADKVVHKPQKESKRLPTSQENQKDWWNQSKGYKSDELRLNLNGSQQRGCSTAYNTPSKV